MLLLLSLLSCAATQVEVTARPLRGEPVLGSLVELSEKSVTLQTAAGPRVFETSALHTIKSGLSSDNQPEQAPAVWIELTDSSTFAGMAVTTTKGKAVVQTTQRDEWTLPAQLVRSIRFHPQEEAVRKQWSTIVAENPVGDVLVVRKVNPTATGPGDVVLDQLPGVVHEIRENAVLFEYDGDRFEVARGKIEGILFRPVRGRELPDPTCRVRDRDNGNWNVQSIRLNQGRLELMTVAGATIEFAAQRLLEIDFSAANLLYLADLEPESLEWRPYFQSATTPSSLSKWFEPKGIPLILAGMSYEKGLALHSRTTVSYRLTRNFRQLAATIGVDERFRTTANMSLVVFGDGRPLLTRPIKGDDEPFDIELNIDGVRRLKIVVDFGDDRSDAGDLLYLCDARLVK